MDYYEFIRTNIFAPAGMINTDWYEADGRTPNLADGYTLEGAVGGKRRSNVYSRPARGSAAGGGYSTAEDLLKFVNAAAAGQFGAASERARGLGIAGGAPGINAALESDLKGGYTVIVLSNYDPPSAERIARELRQMILRVTK
jgi:CubicO group peptidase (beta-lactamase class C family)